MAQDHYSAAQKMIDGDGPADVAQRLRELERQLRRLQRTTTLAILLAAALAVAIICLGEGDTEAFAGTRATTAVSDRDIVRARQIQIVGDDGEVWWELGSSDRHPYLWMMDFDGKKRLWIGTRRVNSGDVSANVILWDQSGKQRVRLGGPSKWQDPIIELANDKAALQLEVISDSPNIRLTRQEADGKKAALIWKAP